MTAWSEGYGPRTASLPSHPAGNAKLILGLSRGFLKNEATDFVENKGSGFVWVRNEATVEGSRQWAEGRGHAVPVRVAVSAKANTEADRWWLKAEGFF